MAETTTISRKEIAEAIKGIEFPKTATYATQPEAREYLELDIVKSFIFAVEEGIPVAVIGDPGTGKTSFALDIAQRVGLQTIYIPAALIAPEDMVVPMPSEVAEKAVLDFLLRQDFKTDTPKLILIDELRRAPKVIQNQLLELVQNLRIADHPIPNVVAVLACDNDGKENGIQADADMALADRFATLQVDPNKTPWRRAIAARFPDVDLTKVYKRYAGLTPRLRYILSPRKLEHVIYNLLKGHPGIWGLSIMGGDRVLLVDENENDRTDEILDGFASDLGVQNREKISMPIQVAFKALQDDGVNLYIEGAPGIGKTAWFRSEVEKIGASLVYMSAPVTTPDSLVVPFPIMNEDTGERELVSLVHRKLAEDTGTPKVLMIDEIWRCSRQVRNMLMEPLQQHTIAGQPIPGLLGVVACNNPKEVAGYKLDVGRPDPAQAGRFAISIQITAEDIPSFEWMLATYGEEAEPFIEWYQYDLPSEDASRVLITRRTIERLIKLARHNLPLEWAKMWLAGEHVPVNLSDLETRLAKRPLARLRYIAEQVDEYEEKLAAGEDEHTDAHNEVFESFSKAELSQLEEHRDVCVRLYRHLKQQLQINLIRSTDRQKFWYEVLRDAKTGPEQSDSK